MLHFKYSRTLLIRTPRNCQHLSCLPDAVDAGYKNTGYKNISVIRSIVCDPFLSFPIEKVPVIRTYRIQEHSSLLPTVFL